MHVHAAAGETQVAEGSLDKVRAGVVFAVQRQRKQRVGLQHNGARRAAPTSVVVRVLERRVAFVHGDGKLLLGLVGVERAQLSSVRFRPPLHFFDVRGDTSAHQSFDEPERVFVHLLRAPQALPGLKVVFPFFVSC